MNIKDFWEDYVVYYLYDKPKYIYRTIRCWFICDALNPWHWKLIWFCLFYNKNWDEHYMWKTLYYQINKSNYYFRNCHVMISDTRLKSVLKWQGIAINLLDSIINQDDLWTWDFIENKYKCLIYVNTKNVKRYSVYSYDYSSKSNKKIQCYEYMISSPHELYVNKAKSLVTKIMYTYTNEWWD